MLKFLKIESYFYNFDEVRGVKLIPLQQPNKRYRNGESKYNTKVIITFVDGSSEEIIVRRPDSHMQAQLIIDVEKQLFPS